MSEDSTLLKSYFDSLGIPKDKLQLEDLEILADDLENGWEHGLALLVRSCDTVEEFLEYLGD